jgi:trimeric autotransporter adhesin
MATITGNNSNNNLLGTADADLIFGLDGNDILDGAGGADVLIGGLDNDTYIVDNAGDIVVEEAGEGTDTIATSISFVLAENVENLILTGTAAINGTGNDADNTLTGNGGNNILDGGEGNDALIGGAGNDTYIVDSAYDTVTEAAFQGTDTVKSEVSFTLGVNIENLILTSTLNVDGTGNDANNSLTGNDSNNILSGGLGVDTLNGAGGQDTLYGGAGNDTLNGGDGNDALYGGDGTDTLNGGAGNDYLEGGAGSDTYIFSYGSGNDSLNNVIGETTGVANKDVVKLAGVAKADVVLMRTAGTFDLVIGLKTAGVVKDTLTIVNYFANAETNSYDTNYITSKIVFDDASVLNNPYTTSITATGDAKNTAWLGGANGNDVLTGLAPADYLVGYGGDDILNGGGGDDSLYGDAYGGGTPWQGSVQFNAVTFVEGNDTLNGGDGNDSLVGAGGNDTLNGDAGNDNLDGGTGNDNLNGGAGDDTLYGRDGNDSITGGAGNDYLEGGAGADTYLFSKGNGTDTVYNYDTDNSIDTIQFTNVATTDITAIYQDFDTPNLIIEYGAGNQVTVQYYFYGDNNYKVDQFKFTDATWTLADIAQHHNGTANAENIYALDGIANTINGMAGDDSLYGGTGNDSLNGGAGNDSLYGGAGSDILTGGTGDDYLEGGAGADTYVFGYGSGNDTINNANGEDPSTFNQDVIKLVGVTAANVVFQRSADNTGHLIIGLKDPVSGVVNDTLTVDYYFTHAENVIWDANYAVSKILLDDGSVLNPFTTIYNITGDKQTARYLEGANANDILTSLAPADTLVGYGGDDILNGGGGNDVLYGDDWNTPPGFDLTSFVEGNDSLYGGSGNDTLYGGGGNDLLDGGTGNDALYGGTGNDTYIVNTAGDGVSENANEGIDQVNSSTSYTLTANVENLLLTGTAYRGTGNELDNQIIGNASINLLLGGLGNDFLDGQAGADTLRGGAGSDIYVVDNTGDVVTENANEGTDTVQSSITWTLATNLENLTLTGNAAINGTGNSANNSLIGNSAANILNGGAGNDILEGKGGADSLIGGAGNDTYYVDNAGDTVTEGLNAGTDSVFSSISYTLSTNLENLTLTGTDAINGTGNNSNNILTGNSANNILTGGAGNDTYFVDNTGDVINENVGEGTDTVNSSVSYTLAANVENLTLVDASPLTKAYSNNFDGVETFASGVSGGLSGVVTTESVQGFVADGFAGNFLRNTATGDPATATTLTLTNLAAHTAIDISFLLALIDSWDSTDGSGGPDYFNVSVDGVTVLQLTAANASGSITYTGSQLGAVTNYGWSGSWNDIAFDMANESALTVAHTASTATIQLFASGAGWQGGDDESWGIENLQVTLAPINPLNGTGNELANTLIGNASNNILDGGLGADTLKGGKGDDTYVVDNLGDIITENANEGNDSVQSSVSYTLSNNVENLSLTGNAAINGTGNTLNNNLIGNAANNVLDGGAGADNLIGGLGNDVLKGAAGADTLTGGDGSDSFVFATVVGGADNVLDFLSSVDKVQLWDGANGLKIGNSNGVIDNAVLSNSHGGFSTGAELVIFTPNISGAITTSTAATDIGSASTAFAIGDTRVFAVDNGVDSALYLFKSAGADALVSSTELTLIGTLQGSAQTALADYTFA